MHFSTNNPQSFAKSLHSPERKAVTTQIAHPPAPHSPTLPDLAHFLPRISGLVQKLSKLAGKYRIRTYFREYKLIFANCLKCTQEKLLRIFIFAVPEDQICIFLFSAHSV